MRLGLAHVRNPRGSTALCKSVPVDRLAGEGLQQSPKAAVSGRAASPSGPGAAHAAATAVLERVRSARLPSLGTKRTIPRCARQPSWKPRKHIRLRSVIWTFGLERRT